MTLTPVQVREVKRFVRRCGAESRMVRRDMVDHLCCLVEDGMGKGLGFEDAFADARTQLPFSEIKEVEADTLGGLGFKTTFSAPVAISATIPYMLLCVAWLIPWFQMLDVRSGGDPPVVFMAMWSSVYFSCAAVFIVGWAKGFPRWCVAYAGYFAVYCFLLGGYVVWELARMSKGEFEVIMATEAHLDLETFAMLMIFIGLPVLVATAIFTPLLKGLRRKLLRLASQVIDDPSLLLLAASGFAPVLFGGWAYGKVSYDKDLLPGSIAAILLLNAGHYLFLTLRTRKARVIAICSGMVLALAVIVATIDLYRYW